MWQNRTLQGRQSQGEADGVMPASFFYWAHVGECRVEGSCRMIGFWFWARPRDRSVMRAIAP
jgi:hypothetical protein